MPLLGFCSSFSFSTEEGSTPSVLAVLVLCLQLLLSPFHGRLASARSSYLTCYGTRVDVPVRRWEPDALETAANVQLSIVSLSSLTKTKSSWRLKTHWDQCKSLCHPPPSNQFGLSEMPETDSVDSDRLLTDASLTGSLKPFSNNLALRKSSRLTGGV